MLVMLGIVIILCVTLACSRGANADNDILINGDFEIGNLSGWTIGGSGGNVEVLQADDFSPEIAVPEGSRFALLSTGPGEINLSPGSDLDGNGFLDNDSATLGQTFSLLPQQVPATLSFRWSFLSADIAGYDDFFMVTLDGANILIGSVPGTSTFTSPFVDVPPLDQIDYTVTSYGLTNGSTFEGGGCGFQDFSYLITTAGSHTLEFDIADQEDRFFDSGLLIDAVRLVLPPSPGSGSAPSPMPALIPTPTPTPTSTPILTPTQTPAPTPESNPTPMLTLARTPIPVQTSTPALSPTATPPESSGHWLLIGGITGGVISATSLVFLLARNFIWWRGGM